MAESPSSTYKTIPQKVLMDTDMTAVQQLMQLSDEDNNNNNKKERNNKEIEVEVDQRRSEITTAKIEEIFGKEEAYRPKKRRYRSLVSIYMATKPMNARYGKKVSS
uniref:Uncharacterized protein n=1 Tax=Fagus sylvatica TaxID=28930 RepID=A0A2N9HRI0_FAGSY